MIARFKSRKARNSWVDDEIWDGKYCREAISARDVAIAARYRGYYNEENLVWHAGGDEGDPPQVYDSLVSAWDS